MLLLILILLAGILLYDGNTRIVTSVYELNYENLPGGFDGYRITVLSDIHAAVFGDSNERLIAKVKATEPDIIAITGDLIDGYEKLPVEMQLDIAGVLAESLIQIAPVYFITGNHDWDSGSIWPLMALLEERGVIILRNKYETLIKGEDTIILAGTDDPNGPADMKKPHEFVEGIRQKEGGSFIVMLEHRNNHLQLYSVLGVELVICGHAHGGLIRLPFTDGLLGQQRDWFPTYTSGVYSSDKTNMVVSRGLGNHTGIPRIFNNPQVVVVELKADA
jgi:predicted MPP superfamily phosphohydrolase